MNTRQQQKYERLVDAHLDDLGEGMVYLPDRMRDWLARLIEVAYPQLTLTEAMLALAFVMAVRKDDGMRSERTQVKLLLRIMESAKLGDFEQTEEVCDECLAQSVLATMKCSPDPQ